MHSETPAQCLDIQPCSSALPYKQAITTKGLQSLLESDETHSLHSDLFHLACLGSNITIAK